MRSALCDWEEGTIFLAECVEAEELCLNYAGLALEAALLACLGVAVAYAWRHCRVGRGEARTRRRHTLVGKARLDGGRAGSDIPSAAAQSAATARSIVCHIVQAASCTSTQTDLSIAPDQLIRWLSPAGSWMDHGTPACTGQVPSVTPPPHARRVSQRPAAEKTSAKPSDDQRLFTQRAVSLAPEPSPPSCTTQEPRPRRAQRRSPPGPDQTPTPAATTTSNSAPNVKLSSGALFLAEMVRRHRAMQETSPETPVRTPVWPPRSAWSAETRAYIEACEGQGGQDEALAPRRRGMQASVHNAVTAISPGQGQTSPMSRTRSTSERETKSAPPPQHAAGGGSQVRRTGTL